MSPITSPQNQYVKLFRSLATAKGRKEHSLFAIEGTHLVEEMIAAGWRAQVGYVCPELLKDQTPARRLKKHADLMVEVAASVFKEMSDTVTPQGIAAAVAIPRQGLEALAAGPGAQDAPPAVLCGAGVVLAVHEVRDPGNMGTMIRTADAAGALGVLAVGDCVDFYSPKVVRAAAGAVFHLPLVAVMGEELLAWADATGTALVATVVQDGTPLPAAALPDRCAVLIGSEAHGLPEALLTACGVRVTIPMPGRAESLNAAIAAGVLLYEYNRQRC
ncbi:MAG: RNA methyltransferase [Armatimonadetes bacterium]|nr:RNA methyltransferase [Armatimonadota bacterium]